MGEINTIPQRPRRAASLLLDIKGGLYKFREARSIPISYMSNRILTGGNNVSNDNINYRLCKSFEL